MLLEVMEDANKTQLPNVSKVFKENRAEFFL